MPTLMSQRTPKFLTMLKEDKSDIQHFSNIFSNPLFLWSGGKIKVLTRKKTIHVFLIMEFWDIHWGIEALLNSSSCPNIKNYGSYSLLLSGKS